MRVSTKRGCPVPITTAAESIGLRRIFPSNWGFRVHPNASENEHGTAPHVQGIGIEVLPLRVRMETLAPAFPAGEFLPAQIRGILLSATTYALCLCASPRARHDEACTVHQLFEGVHPGDEAPYAIGPATIDPRGFEFTLLLYGRSAEHAPSLASAMNSLAGHGIGKERTPVHTITLRDLRSGDLLYHSAEGYFYPAPSFPVVPPIRLDPLDRTRVEIRTRTPLSLGWRASDCLQVPRLTPDALFHALKRKLQARGAPESAVQTLLRPLQDCEYTHGRSHWVNLARYSPRQRRRYSLHGIEGQWTWTCADTAAMQPIAEVLTWLPVGGRTAFGFGSLQIHSSPTNAPLAPSVDMELESTI